MQTQGITATLMSLLMFAKRGLFRQRPWEYYNCKTMINVMKIKTHHIHQCPLDMLPEVTYYQHQQQSPQLNMMSRMNSFQSLHQTQLWNYNGNTTTSYRSSMDSRECVTGVGYLCISHCLYTSLFLSLFLSNIHPFLSSCLPIRTNTVLLL